MLNRKRMIILLQYDPSLKKVFRLSASELSSLLSLSREKSFSFYKKIQSQSLQKETLSVLRQFNIVTIFDENYPHVLKTIKDPPLVLYTIGNSKLLNKKPSLSVIGTRNPSQHAKEKLSTITEPIVRKGWVIVSGMALGIDSYAHQLTLNLHGHTIAVLGSGFNHIYPKQHEDLFRLICKRGLVISEYPPHIKPARYHFPERNRIISGLSFGTLVIEATMKSGTLITVDQALDQGREVFAVPDSPLVRQAVGCNMLIKEGAQLVTSSEDILYNWEQISDVMV